MKDGGAGGIYSDTVEMGEGSAAGLVIAQQVNGENIQTKLLLAGKVDGSVETLLDTNQALFFGIAAGAVISLFLLIGQFFTRRR